MRDDVLEFIAKVDRLTGQIFSSIYQIPEILHNYKAESWKTLKRQSKIFFVPTNNSHSSFTSQNRAYQ